MTKLIINSFGKLIDRKIYIGYKYQTTPPIYVGAFIPKSPDYIKINIAYDEQGNQTIY